MENEVLTPGGYRAAATTQFVPQGKVVTGSGQLDELVLTPGGYHPKSQTQFVEPGHGIDLSTGNLRKINMATKEVVADYGKLSIRPGNSPLMPGNVFRHPSVTPALGSGWIVYADWTNNSGQPVTLFKTTWVVPPAPATDHGQTIFLFNGIQNQTMIYQPVLQWGPSAAGGGSYWSIASWYVDGQGGPAYHSTLINVNPGQVITGVMTLTGQNGSNFSYNCDFDGIANSSLPISNVQELTWCIETLEAYSISVASDYPNTARTAMTGIEIKVGGNEASLNWAAVNSVTDCGQHAQVVSNNSPGGEVDIYYSNAFFNKVTLGDTSPKNTSLAYLNGRLFIAWKGDGNDNLNVMYSTDNGHTFGNKYVSGETSPQAPALCEHNGSLYISWKGDGNDNLNVAMVSMQGNAITGFTNKVTLGDTSQLSPSMASLNGRLYIAWKGDGNANLNVMYSADNGHTFGNKYVSGETSAQAPALCVYNGNLFISWKGNGNDNLNVAMVGISGNAITGFTNKVTLGDTSPVSPSIASVNGRLYIAWKGDGNDNLNVMYSTDNGHTFGNKYTSGETSPQPPSLGASAETLFISWKGDGNDNLNVADVYFV